MTARTQLERVIDVIKEVLCLDETPGPDENIGDLGADSLDTVEITMDLEEEFGFEISDDDPAFETCDTPRKISEYVTLRLANV